jgi:hypothetical protein
VKYIHIHTHRHGQDRTRHPLQQTHVHGVERGQTERTEDGLGLQEHPWYVSVCVHGLGVQEHPWYVCVCIYMCTRRRQRPTPHPPDPEGAHAGPTGGVSDAVVSRCE